MVVAQGAVQDVASAAAAAVTVQLLSLKLHSNLRKVVLFSSTSSLF